MRRSAPPDLGVLLAGLAAVPTAPAGATGRPAPVPYLRAHPTVP
jgi:hypothetical protein